MPSDHDPLHGQADPRMAIVWTLKVLPFAVFFGIFAAIAWAIGAMAMAPDGPGLGPGLQIHWGLGIGLAVTLSAIAAIGALVYARNYRWEVGADEVRVHRGLIGRHRARVPYERVQNVNLSQSALMRPFGVWSVVLETAGSAGPKARPEGVLAGVDDPERWEQAVTERMAAAGEDGV